MATKQATSPSATGRTKYRRVVLKISGEGFGKPGVVGIDGQSVHRISEEVMRVAKLGVQVAVVVGGGNFIRGAAVASKSNIQGATAHYMGMLSTVINALALQDVLEDLGQPTRVQSSIAMQSVCENFIRRRCIRHLTKGRVVILAAGTGRPFVTTDTAAALAAVEISADVLIKATKVDGVFSADPAKDDKAELISALSYNEVIDGRLEVMDVSAIDMCQRHGVPIVVLSLLEQGNMEKVVLGQKIGSLISC